VAESRSDLFAKRPVGKTGLMVTPIGMGTAPLGDMTDVFTFTVPEDRALETVRTFFRSPLNLIDTAAAYGDGTAERRIGAVLRELGGLPEGFVLETKADQDFRTNDWSAAQMRRSVERSLRLLGVDRLQVCLIHDTEHSTWEYVTGKGGPLEELLKMKGEGLIDHLGIGAGPIDMIMRYVELGVIEVVMSHNRWNLLDREAEPLMDLCVARGVAFFNAAPYGSGILAKGPDAFARFRYHDAEPVLLERARKMQEACSRHGVPLAAAALQFSLRDPRVTSTVLGMTRPERIQQTIELAQTPIPEDLWPELIALGASREGLPTTSP
jgi:D-threo-aldose 1-dehydrogenase